MQELTERRQVREVRGADVPIRLRELGPGLSIELFEEVIKASEQARSRASTRFYPVNGGGTAAYNERTSVCRMLLFPFGWTPEDPKGAPAAVHPEGHLQIMMATGDEWTGLDELPTTQYPKGPCMEDLVAANAQCSIEFPDWTEVRRPKLSKVPSISVGQRVTYVLFLRRDIVLDKEGKTAVQMRAELSLPVEMSGGHPTEYLERIFLDSIMITSTDPSDDFGDSGDIIVPVERR